jgi:thiamine-phosphate pyrophosphorylase
MEPSSVQVPVLHLITDPRLPRERLLAAVRAAVTNGVDLVQVRDHAAASRELFDLARDIVEICRPAHVIVAVNDRVDVALAVGVDTVQVGARGLPIAVIRRVAPTLRIGASVHDLAAAKTAAAAGADWVTFGHVFPTRSHPDEPARGLAELARVVDTCSAPVVAIGGIDLENVDGVVAAGAHGIAAISAILDADDPGQAARELRAHLPAATVPPGEVLIRRWRDADLPGVRALAAVEGWTTYAERPELARQACQGSWPCLVAVDDGDVVGFLRAIADGAVTLYVAELLVANQWRGRGLGRKLLGVAQRLVPGARIDLLATSTSRTYYERLGFRGFAGFRRAWEELEG